MARLVLFDGAQSLFRSFRLPLNRSYKNRDTSIVYKYLNELAGLVSTQKPTHLCLALDPTIKHLQEKPNDPTLAQLRWQYEQLAPVTQSLGICTYQVQPFSADDIISTLAKQAQVQHEAFDHTTIVSNDKDFYQCLSNRVSIIKIQGSHYYHYGIQQFVSEYGFDPKYYVDYSALADEDLGVPGIGDKISRKLIRDFGSISSIISAAEARVRYQHSTEKKDGKEEAMDDNSSSKESSRKINRSRAEALSQFWRRNRKVAIRSAFGFSPNGGFDQPKTASLIVNNPNLNENFHRLQLKNVPGLDIHATAFNGFNLQMATPVIKELGLFPLLDRLSLANKSWGIPNSKPSLLKVGKEKKREKSGYVAMNL